MKSVTIYTDGACSRNPGPGGWGAILMFGDEQKIIYGSDVETTNNRMELKAAIEALSSLEERMSVTIYTDSKYMKDGIEVWVQNWKSNGWKTARNQQVKNVDLWKELYATTQKHEIVWRWVKGHSSDSMNNAVDKLARSQIKH